MIGTLLLAGALSTGRDVLAEVRRFARVAARLDLRVYTPAPERAAVLVPAERYEPLPSLAGLYAPRSCLQAYTAAKEAHLPVTLAREGDELTLAPGRDEPGGNTLRITGLKLDAVQVSA